MLLSEGAWKTLELQARKVTCCGQSLTGHSFWSLEDGTAESAVDSSRDPAHEVLEGTQILLATGLEAIHVIVPQRIWLHSARALRICMHEAELKSNGLISLMEKISRQNNIESVECLFLIKHTQWGGREHQEA